MNLSFCSFASSSSGNSYIIKNKENAILVDIGLTMKMMDEKLSGAEIDYDSIGAILITHEHIDHVKSLHSIMNKRIKEGKVYLTEGTKEALLRKRRYDTSRFEIVKDKDMFFVGDIEVRVFKTNHDSKESVSFTFSSKGKKIAIVTDCGYISEDIFQQIKDADLLIMEANHEKNLLLYNSKYTYTLKQRILSDNGHLSNESAGNCIARYLREYTKEETPVVMLAHLSEENNSPMQAYLTVKNILEEEGFYSGKDVILDVAQKDESSRWISI